jgi:hypothetical protein
MSSTQEILNHHLACFAASDLEGTLADFGEDSVLLTPQGPLRGLPAIRTFFEAAFAEFAQPGTQLKLNQMVVEGECAYVAWEAETSANRYEAATDTFLIRDGRIALQAFGAKITPHVARHSNAALDAGTEYSGIGVA